MISDDGYFLAEGSYSIKVFAEYPYTPECYKFDDYYIECPFCLTKFKAKRIPIGDGEARFSKYCDKACFLAYKKERALCLEKKKRR